MKKTILTLLLAAMSTGAIAEWVETFVFTNDKSTKFYANPSSINRAGSKATMWTMMSSSTELKMDDVKYRSFQSMNEYDCAQRLVRNIETRYYSEPMGGGFRVQEPERFRGNSPFGFDLSTNTPADKSWELACGRTKLK